MANRTPSLEEAQKASFEYNMSSVYTSIPAIVVSVKDLGQQRIDVLPAINQRSRDGEEEAQRAAILNVPLQMPVTQLGGLTFPINVGDSVYLHFSMRGLDVWKRNSIKPTTPSDVRQFDKRDCIATPGSYPFGESPNGSGKRTHSHSTNDVVLVHNIGTGSEVEIRLKPNGDVFINSPTKVTVNCVDAEVNADSSVVANTNNAEVNASLTTINSEVIINGETTVNGLLTYTAGLVGEGSGGAGAIITGGAQFVGGSVTHNGTDIGDTHTHGGIMPGGGDTDVPN